MKSPHMDKEIEEIARKLLRKVKYYEINVKMFIESSYFKEGEGPTPYHYFFKGLPEDALFIDMRVNPFRPDFLLIKVASETFEEIREEDPIPLADTMTVHTLTCETYKEDYDTN